VERIDRRELLEEIDGLEDASARALLTDATTKGREVYALSKDVWLAKKLATHTLTPSDWEQYLSRREAVHRIPARIATLDKEGLAEGSDFSSQVSIFEGFYEAGVERNEALVENPASGLRSLMHRQRASTGRPPW
jgi:hypothetical protein